MSNISIGDINVLILIPIIFLAGLSYNLINQNLKNKVCKLCSCCLYALLFLLTIGIYFFSVFDKFHLGASFIIYVIIVYPVTLVCWILSLVLLRFIKLEELSKFIISSLPVLPAVGTNIFLLYFVVSPHL